MEGMQGRLQLQGLKMPLALRARLRSQESSSAPDSGML